MRRHSGERLLYGGHLLTREQIEKTRAENRLRYHNDIDETRKRRREYYEKNRTKLLAYAKEYTKRTHRKTDSVKGNIRTKERLKILKKELSNMLGGKCQKCGDSDVRHLVFHHKNGNGGKERKGISRAKYLQLWLDNNGAGLELLCANCHSEIHFG